MSIKSRRRCRRNSRALGGAGSSQQGTGGNGGLGGRTGKRRQRRYNLPPLPVTGNIEFTNLIASGENAGTYLSGGGGAGGDGQRGETEALLLALETEGNEISSIVLKSTSGAQ